MQQPMQVQQLVHSQHAEAGCASASCCTSGAMYSGVPWLMPLACGQESMVHYVRGVLWLQWPG